MKEFDPSRDITNLETFQSFMENFRSRILETPPHMKHFPSNLPPDPANTAMHTTEDNFYHKELIKITLKGRVFIDGIPWDSIPESLQQLLSIQYDSARLNEDKKINIQIRRRDVRFSLESAHSYNNIDWEGEYYAPGLVLKMLRNDFDDEVDRMIGGKRINEGDLIVNKTVLSTQLRLNSLLQVGSDRRLTDEEKEFLQRTTIDSSWRKVQLIPSTLVDLQDIAKVLTAQKERAFIYSD